MSMIIQIPDKLADEVIDYVIDFSERLAASDRIVGAGTVVPAAATVTIASPTHSDTEVKVRISGGAFGDISTFIVEATTATGQILAQTLRVYVAG